ncbi:hypothetical protein F5144DRAFT_250524 [Chaetomium tenue]|uniref:Uncharacterized protein n=1 Tax=Chaetomium tenue TaxID=1854479 RepID=A0ACB7PDX5_9PEZI|nr:hypothetical protein F5144DRAFT_250524 [Chaetomium globosum]
MDTHPLKTNHLSPTQPSPFDLPTIYTTLLPITIGTILAAAVLPLLTQPAQQQHTTTTTTKQQPRLQSRLQPRLQPPQHTFSLLALATLTTTLLHQITHILPQLTPTPTTPPPPLPTTAPATFFLIATITINLLQGFASTCTLALALYLSGGGARVRAVCVAGAVGAVVSAVRAVGFGGGSGEMGGGANGGYEGRAVGCGGLWWWWVGEMALGLVAVGGSVLPGVGVTAEREGERGREKVVLGEDGQVGAEMMLLDGGGYPPPASRATIFGALFAFAYHAATAAIPAGLDSLVLGRDGITGRSPPVFTIAMFWAWVAVGRVVALPCSGLTRPRQGVPRAVLGTGGFLFLFWLLPNAARYTGVAAGLAGAVLGPVYPCVLSMVMRELGEDEMLGAMGIIVAFGHLGVVSALLTIQLVAYVDAPVVLLLFIVILFGSMLVCWEILTGRDDGSSVFDRRDNV